MTTQREIRPRVLLADDEPDNIRVLAAALEDAYTLSFATSGNEALRLARSDSRPDVMLVDVMMTDLDGFEVCAALRGDPATADIPVIFVTALDDRINEEKGFEVGAVDYIAKPISPSIVRARVRVHLELKRHRSFLENLLERRTEDLEVARNDVRQVLGDLRESRERFRDFAEASSDWFWETDPDLQFTYLSEEDSRPLKHSAVERLNLTREGGGTRGDALENPKKWQDLWASLEARRPFRNFEFPVQDEAGKTGYIRASGKPVKDAGGAFKGYRGVASDVTDVMESQHQAEALRNAIDVSDDAVVLLSRDQRVVFTNDAFHRIFTDAPAKDEIVGMEREQIVRELEIMGWNEDPLVTPEHGVPVDELEGWDADDEVTIGDYGRGKQLTYLRRRRVFGNGQALTTFTDITRRKEFEAELRRLASEVSLAEERERRRIAAELHDGSVQKLGVSRMRLGMLLTKLARAEEVAEIQEICGLLDRSIREVRSLMSELSSPILYELGLEPAVEWLAQRFQSRHGLACEVELDEECPRLSNDVEVSLFQAVRELLVNVVKHAEATKVSIGVRRLGSQLLVRVQDDGKGIDPKHVGKHPSDTGGFGLFSVRERLGLLGGHLQIESEAGARITMTVPLAAHGSDGL